MALSNHTCTCFSEPRPVPREPVFRANSSHAYLVEKWEALHLLTLFLISNYMQNLQSLLHSSFGAELQEGPL